MKVRYKNSVIENIIKAKEMAGALGKKLECIELNTEETKELKEAMGINHMLVFPPGHLISGGRPKGATAKVHGVYLILNVEGV